MGENAGRSVSRISRNISIILRAERMVARRHIAVLRNQTGLLAFAALVAAIGLVMLNIAGFFLLRATLSPQAATLIVGVVNFALAVLLVILATRQNAEQELEPITELRDLAIEDLGAEMQGTIDEAREVADNVRRIARDPLGTALPAMAIPLLSALLRSIKK